MSHLGEGQLHAYLDNERHDGITALRHEVDVHLAACAQCRARLAEERRMRDRAAAILRAGGPGAVTAPPFEQLAARKRSESLRRAPRIQVLAWAATVALALGLGWYARSAFVGESPAASELAADRAIAPPPPRVALEAAPQESVEGAARPGAGPVREAAQAPPPAEAALQPADRPARALAANESPALGGDTAQAPTQRVVEAETRPNTRDLAQLAVRRVPPESASAPQPPIQAPVPPVRSELRLDEAVVPAAATPAIDRTEAERRLNDQLAAIPELETVRITAGEEAGTPVVRTLHRLPDGRTIELVQERIVAGEDEAVRLRRAAEPAPAAARAEAPRRAATQEAATATREWSNSRVTARGPLPADSLRALLRLLRRAQAPKPDQF